MLRRKLLIAGVVTSTLFSAPYIANATTQAIWSDDILSIFSGDYFSNYFEGFEVFIQELEDYGFVALDDAFREVMGHLGLADMLSVEAAFQDQLKRGEHIIRLTDPPRDLLGEIVARQVANEQARTQASRLLTEQGQERVMDRIISVTTNTEIAEQQAVEAEAALSSQTAIKKLAAISSQNTKVLSGLTNEVINSRVDSAVGLEVMTSVAEQLDELQSLEWAEQRGQLDSLVRVTLGVPASFRQGEVAP